MIGSRIAFLLSGAGSTLKNLLERIDTGEVPGHVVVVIADRPAAGLEHAKARGIPTAIVDRKVRVGNAFHDAVEAALLPHMPDLVVLGGWMSILRIPPALAGRVLNVHPSLLPAFGGRRMYGERVHRAVLESGVRVTGCTVHVVTAMVDSGPIVEQEAVRVEDGDTPESLAARVQEAERRVYPACIRGFLEGALRVEGTRVVRAR